MSLGVKGRDNEESGIEATEQKWAVASVDVVECLMGVMQK